MFETPAGGPKERDASLMQFRQDPEVKVLLLSLARDSSGLTLTEANHVFLVEPRYSRVCVGDARSGRLTPHHYANSFNPALEQQAIHRVHRMGQRKPCFVYRLIAANTVEVTVQRRQRDRWQVCCCARRVGAWVVQRCVGADTTRLLTSSRAQHMGVGSEALQQASQAKEAAVPVEEAMQLLLGPEAVSGLQAIEEGDEATSSDDEVM